MRKLIFILAFLISQNLISNPIVPPPVISEFFYNGGNWQMEIYFTSEWHGYYEISGFEDLKLVSNSGEALFVGGLTFQWDSLMVIDQSMLASFLSIDPDEEYLRIVFADGGGGWYWACDGIQYGPNPNQNITTPPGPNESICIQYIYKSGLLYYYVPLKQSPPTIGSEPFNVTSRSTFSGYVFDQFTQPVGGIRFVYIDEAFCYGITVPSYACFETDENGYFETDGLFSNWHQFELTKDGYVFLADNIFIEPGNQYKEYNLTDVGISTNKLLKEITLVAAPNPFTNRTTYHISIPDGLIWEEAKISIRNMTGQAIDFIPVTNNPWVGGEISVDWAPGNQPKGLYIYSFMMDGQAVKSGKLIMY